MGQPNVVVIDDSEAILAFTRSVLVSHYAVSTAKDGREGLELCARVRPQVVLLDLSMPELDGEQVLARLKADPALESIPVVIISSERARAEACLGRGAAAFLAKPLRAEELAAAVDRALEVARTHSRRGSVAILPLGVGPLELAIPLADVKTVLLQTATLPLPAGPSYLLEMFELFGESICVLDLAARLGVEHAEPVVDRKLVVIEHDGVKLALCADRVRDPEEILPGDFDPIIPDPTPAGMIDIGGAVQAVARTSRGPVSVIAPHALLSRGLVRSIATRARAAASK